MQIVIGAAVFALGCLFGACLILAGQQTKPNRTSQKFQDAILKNLEKAASEREPNKRG